MLINSNIVANGFANGTDQEVSELAKALEAGYQTGVSRTGGSTLRVESLDASLKVLTYSNQHIKLWKKIPKSPAYSTVEEWNELSSYGTRTSPFVAEAEVGQAIDASFARRSTFMKFLRRVAEVSHISTVVHSAHGDVVALQNMTVINQLLGDMEDYLHRGDSSLAPSGSMGFEFNGLDTLIDSTMVFDCEGNSLQEAVVEECANTLTENFSAPTDLFMSTRALSDFNKTLYPRTRMALPAPVNGQVGMAISSLLTSAGVVELTPNTFIKSTRSPLAVATSPYAPAAPASIAASAVTGTDGFFTKADPGGDTYVSYAVTAGNRFGESAPVMIGSAVALSAANKLAGVRVPLTVTNPSSMGAYLPEYFNIYRTVQSASSSVPAAVSSYSLIARIPTNSVAASGTTTLNDRNVYLPFTSTAYIGDMSVLTYRQLLPLHKIDLAVTGPSFRWMIGLCGAPVLFAPKKWMRIINIGDLSVP